MIRPRGIGGSQFDQFLCPNDSLPCERPYCPFMHITTRNELQLPANDARNGLANETTTAITNGIVIKQEPDDEIIILEEKLSPRAAQQCQHCCHCSHHNHTGQVQAVRPSSAATQAIPVLEQTTSSVEGQSTFSSVVAPPVIQQEAQAQDEFLGGYFAYVSPGAETGQPVTTGFGDANNNGHEHGGLGEGNNPVATGYNATNAQPVLFPDSYSMVNTSQNQFVPQQPLHRLQHPHFSTQLNAAVTVQNGFPSTDPNHQSKKSKDGRKKAVSGIPAYIPTPIDQLQREEDARHKRRELIDRQQRIRERLEKQQKEATTITKDKKAWANEQQTSSLESGCPIDQILAEQEEFHSDNHAKKEQEVMRVELEKRRQREQLEQQKEMRRQRKGITLKDGGSTSTGPIMATLTGKKATTIAPGSEKQTTGCWLGKKVPEKIMDQIGKQADAWRAKTRPKVAEIGGIAGVDKNGEREAEKEEFEAALRKIKERSKKRDREEVEAEEHAKIKADNAAHRNLLKDFPIGIPRDQQQRRNSVEMWSAKERGKEVLSSKHKETETKNGGTAKKKPMRVPEAGNYELRLSDFDSSSADSSPRKQPLAKADSINDCVKNISQLEKSIQSLEKEIFSSNDKLSKLPQAIASASTSNSSKRKEKTLQLEEGKEADEFEAALRKIQEVDQKEEDGTLMPVMVDRKNRPPIWRRRETFSSKLAKDYEETMMGTTTPKTNDNILDRLFGQDEGDGAEDGPETSSLGKKEDQKKKKQIKAKKPKDEPHAHPHWELTADDKNSRKRRHSSTGSQKQENPEKRPKKMSGGAKAEDDKTRHERQELVDLISDGEENGGGDDDDDIVALDGPPIRKYPMAVDNEIVVLSSSTSGQTAKTDRKAAERREKEKSSNVWVTSDGDTGGGEKHRKSSKDEPNGTKMPKSQTIPPKEEKYFSVSGKNSALELPPKMKTQHPAKSASTSSTLMPGYSTPKRRPPSPALSVASSVSVVPETPPSRLASPIRPTENVLSAAASGARPQMGTSNNIGGSKRTILPTAQEQLHSRTVHAFLQQQQQLAANQPLPTRKFSITSPLARSTKTPPPPSSSSNAASTSTHQAPMGSQKSQALKTQQQQSTTSSAPRPTSSSFLVKKGEPRKAHQPKLPTIAKATRQLVPLDQNNRKVALQMRQMQLERIHAEYAKIYYADPDLAIENAQLEEQEILNKCLSRMGYVASVPNVIKRLRDLAANNDKESRNPHDKVSHQNMLLGRHANSVTLGLHRAQRLGQQRTTHFSELDFYNSLESEYLLNAEQLWANGYPRWVDTAAEEQKPEEEDGFESLFPAHYRKSNRRVEIRPSELDASKGRSQQQFVPDSELKRVCARCGAEYRLTKEADYARGASSDECIYHWGRAWKKRVSGTVDTRYTCCQSGLDVRGCVVGSHHITQSLRLSTLEKYAPTPNPMGVGDARSKKVYALDCEMVYCVWGPEVARISMVDMSGELVLDLLVRPESTLVDCNTKFSGLNADQVNNAENNLEQARSRLFEFVNSETILIGHSLESDLRALRIVHPRVVDTSVVFPHRLGPPQKRALKTLATEFLQQIIQEDESGHDSKEDALACMRIMLKKVRGTEQ